jgi:superfamily I DNA/RNA helicase
MNGWLKSKLTHNRRILDCLTFHQWSYKFGYSYDFDQDDEERKIVIELARKSGKSYQAILVDEAQDFYDEWFQCLLEVLEPETNSLFFVYDNTQSVYGQPHRLRNWTWTSLGLNIPGSRSQILDVSYRNSPEILNLAWKFISETLERSNITVSNRQQAQGKIGNIVKPITKLSRSSNINPILLQIPNETMALAIAQQVQLGLTSYPGSSIGILTHPQYKDLRQDISRELWTLGIQHHAPTTSQERDRNIVNRPFVIVDSWNALKGVEFDAVIIAGLDMANEFPHDPDADFQEKAGIYTAMTRARDHLVILYDTKNSIVDLMENALNSPPQLESQD